MLLLVHGFGWFGCGTSILVQIVAIGCVVSGLPSQYDQSVIVDSSREQSSIVDSELFVRFILSVRF